MPVSVGDKLGPYQILAAIGAGGMGEVFRARDTRLGRDVAVKILPEAFAQEEDRMRRFEQEARAVAALNHPNVLAIYDTGAQDGVRYLVSELLEGDTLRQRLSHGKLAPRKAAEYARQIADGLAAAHEKRIVHRDLKPENLFLTASGRVKILDFGLAKVPASESARAAPDASTATMTAVTSPRAVMGTAGYMAPEQVRGEAADLRADIFSLGATIYEMLAGKRAFKGETAIETLNAILKEEPPELDVDKAHIPPALERIVRHCLEKRPADRFQSARDLIFALDDILTTSVSAPARALPFSNSIGKLVAVAALSAALGAGALYWASPLTAPLDRAEFAINVPGEVSHLSLSQDGKWLAFVCPGETDGSPMVFVQRIGSASARAIPESEGASYPFWSPDHQFVAFFSKGKLRKAAPSGGAPQNLAAVGSAPRGGSWGSKGVILYTPDSSLPIWRVNADGSGAGALASTQVKANEFAARWPFFLPDGDHFLMWAGNFNVSEQRANTVYLDSLSKPGRTALFDARSNAVYADGRVFYADENGALASVSLDVASARITGSPRVIAPKVARSASTFYTAVAAANSTLVYSATSAANHSQLTWFDESGNAIGRVGPVGVLANPALSPDGNRVAFDSNDPKTNNVDVWILDLRNGGASRFTFAPEEETMPVWSRDGSFIMYRAQTSVHASLYVKRVNGLESPRRVDEDRHDIVSNAATSWSTDDRELLCMGRTPRGATDLMILLLDTRKMRPFIVGPGIKSHGQISPDGKWVAYASNEGGEWEIYVTTYPDANGKWQVSRAGGTEPRWRGDSKAVFYIGPQQMLTEATVSTDGVFSTTSTRPLFPIRARPPISYTDLMAYDVTRDGKRFLVNQYVRPAQAPPLNIVIHAGSSPAK